MPVGLKVVGCEDLETSDKNALDFELFWRHYPRKIAKRTAARAWMRLTDAEKAAALEALPRHCRIWARRGEMQFVPHAATWLNQARWEDELEEFDARPCKWKNCDKEGTVQNGTGHYCERHYAALLRGETPR